MARSPAPRAVTATTPILKIMLTATVPPIASAASDGDSAPGASPDSVTIAASTSKLPAKNSDHAVPLSPKLACAQRTSSAAPATATRKPSAGSSAIGLPMGRGVPVSAALADHRQLTNAMTAPTTSAGPIARAIGHNAGAASSAIRIRTRTYITALAIAIPAVNGPCSPARIRAESDAVTAVEE